MRNRELERVADIFVGDWNGSVANQRRLDDATTVTSGSGQGEWLGDAFVQLRAWFVGDGNEIFGPTALALSEDLGQPALHYVFGRSDARDRFAALSHDERGVSRIFDLTLDGTSGHSSVTTPTTRCSGAHSCNSGEPRWRRATGYRCLTLPSSSTWHLCGRPGAVNVVVSWTPARGSTNRPPHIAHVRTS
jgi:hypothetical protein